MKPHIRPFPGLLILTGLAVLIVTGAVLLHRSQGGGTVAASASPHHETTGEHNAPPASPPQPPAIIRIAPSFDIIRTNPQGGVVIAGRAAPQAHVLVTDNGRPLADINADSHGDWVIVLDHPLAPGQHDLRLRTRNRDGSNTDGEAPVVMSVPAGEQGTKTLAVRMNSDGSSDILQGPAGQPGGLGIVSVTLSHHDRLTIRGTAPAGASIRLYVDGMAKGLAVAGQQGNWRLTVTVDQSDAPRLIRADQTGSDGTSVTARAETSFTPPAADLPPEDSVTVRPGNSLWRIARRSLGSGLAYAEIYEANRDQIRNPDLIYPGQVLKLPQKP